MSIGPLKKAKFSSDTRSDSPCLPSCEYSFSEYGFHKLIDHKHDLLSFVEDMYEEKLTVDVNEDLLKPAAIESGEKVFTSKNSEDLMKKLIEKYLDGLGCKVECRKEIVHLCSLPPMTSSTNIKPDITVFSNDFPICFIEVHSGSGQKDYGRTVLKSVINTMDLIRKYLEVMHDDDKTDEKTDDGKIETDEFFGLNAFVLPKCDPGDKSFLTQVTVKFLFKLKLRFSVEFEYVEPRDLKTKIECACKNVQKMIGRVRLPTPSSKYSECSYFLRLPKKFLVDHHVHQVFSKHNIVLRNEQNILKYVAHKDERSSCFYLENLRLRQKVPLYSLFPIRNQIIAGLTFFVYETLEPVTYEKAKKNLPIYAYEVIRALNELHDTFDLAHLDVRLENLCLNSSGQIVLIDLDRCQTASEDFSSDQYTSSCMYNTPITESDEFKQLEAVTNSHMDWVQFGYMIMWLICREQNDLYHTMSVNLLQKVKTLFGDKCYYFLGKLIIEGECTCEKEDDLQSMLQPIQSNKKD